MAKYRANLKTEVGASGSGKSTIVGLLDRWYELDGNMTDNIIVGSLSLHEYLS